MFFTIHILNFKRGKDSYEYFKKSLYHFKAFNNLFFVLLKKDIEIVLIKKNLNTTVGNFEAVSFGTKKLMSNE